MHDNRIQVSSTAIQLTARQLGTWDFTSTITEPATGHPTLGTQALSQESEVAEKGRDVTGLGLRKFCVELRAELGAREKPTIKDVNVPQGS